MTVENLFTRGFVNKKLHINVNSSSILVQIYIDDIIFGSTDEKFWQKFVKFMQSKYEMSLLRDLTYFLGLQTNKTRDPIDN